MKKKIYLPSKGAEDWKSFLAKDSHWSTGYSAKSLAYCWEEATQFPDEFEKAFQTIGLNLEILLAIPEFQVMLNNDKAPSQNDLFVLARDSEGLVVIMIEGKVSEKFDSIIAKWNTSKTKVERFIFLTNKLEINNNIDEYSELYYQLFHRTVSPILIAEKFFAKKAIMIVHSFSQTNKWFSDYEAFVKRLNPNIDSTVNTINKCKTLKSGIELYTGWINGSVEFLSK